MNPYIYIFLRQNVHSRKAEDSGDILEYVYNIQLTDFG